MKRQMLKMIPIMAMCVSIGAYAATDEQPDQPRYASPAEAGEHLFQAVQQNDEPAIAKILGGPTELTSSANGDQDKVDREMFVKKYQEMHRLHRDADGSVTLYIGPENWPFPVPLVAKNGGWQFNPEAGSKEIMFRRIGDNELTAIATCREFVDAERHYSEDANTAEVTGSSPASLVAKAVKGSGGGDQVLLHGYYFRALPVEATKGSAQGSHRKFVLMAYPAEYRSSGVMSFIVTESGVVYEKDLGTETSKLAGAMTTFHKDTTWRPAQD